MNKQNLKEFKDRILGKKMTLLELSNVLMDFGFEDIFNYDVQEYVLVENNKGSFSNKNGTIIIYFSYSSADKKLAIGKKDFFDLEVEVYEITDL